MRCGALRCGAMRCSTVECLPVCRKNIFIGAGEKFINSFTRQITGFTNSGSVNIDSNVFLYCRGPIGGYFGQSTYLPDVTVNLTNNWFGKWRFIYNKVY